MAYSVACKEAMCSLTNLFRLLSSLQLNAPLSVLVAAAEELPLPALLGPLLPAFDSSTVVPLIRQADRYSHKFLRAVYASEKFFFRDLFRKYELRLDHSRASISFSNPVSHITSDTENSICCLELRRAPTTFLKVFLIANSFANMIDSFFWPTTNMC